MCSRSKACKSTRNDRFSIRNATFSYSGPIGAAARSSDRSYRQTIYAKSHSRSRSERGSACPRQTSTRWWSSSLRGLTR